MKPTNPRFNMLNILVCVLILSSNYLLSQNFSGLENKKLNKIDDIAAVGVSLFAERIKGKINDVIVTYDSERKLKVTVSFNEFNNHNYTLIAEIKNTKKIKQKEFKQVRLNLKDATSPVELEFNLDENTPEGTELSSPFLELRIGSKNLKPIFLYSLNKNWKTEINAENLIIPITAEPVGSAANLKETQQRIIIPKKKPQLKYTIDKTKLIKLSQPLATSSIKPTSVKSNSIDGTWTNNNKNTGGLTKIIISGNGTKIQAFGKCSPRDCNWGVKKLTPRGSTKDQYWGIFDSRVAKSTFLLIFNKNNLEIRHQRDYKSATRPTKRTVEKFTKFQMFIAPVVYTPVRTSTTTEKEKEVAVNTEPEGPDNNPISLWEDLVADHDFEFPYEITNIRMDIYPDKNLASGTFYYLPTAFHLRWNTNEGYQFKMLYGTAESSESSGNVRMNGTLTPGISSKEIALMKSLLQSYVEDNPNYSFTELKIMPTNSTPEISLSSGLEGQYDISSDKINVSVSSSLTNPIDVSWSTDNQTKDDMQNALSEGVGIKGTMTLNPNSETVPAQNIPIRITLADTRTLGKFILEPNQWRTENWTNNTPFPLRLKKVHALIIEKQGNTTIPLIYTWDLNNTEVPSKASVSFDTSKMPQWIETKNKTEQIWLDYSIVECSPCVNQVVDELTGGTSESKVKHISFETFQLFEETDIAFLQVKIRSKYIDTKGETVKESSVVRISQDNTAFEVGPLYIPEDKSLDFEYFITLVTKSGNTHESDNWITHDNLFMFLGMEKLKQVISSYNTEDSEEIKD